jgi:hypothetical protein
MMPTCPPLLAEGAVRTTFEWKNIQSNADWILPIGVLLGILLFVRTLYRRDAVELNPALGWLLTFLRTATFLALLVLYLQPQWRTEEEKVKNSRVLLLVDTSLSMGMSDTDAAAAGSAASRVQQVAAALTQTDLLRQLRKTHDIEVAQFDEELHRDRVVSLPKLAPEPAPGDRLDAAGSASQAKAADASPQHSAGKPKADDDLDWAKTLALSGEETRLGQALRQLISNEASEPVSGVILFSDGGQNAGIGPEAAIEAAREAKVPVFTVGIGSDRLPPNVRVSAFNPPPRAYPGDPYSVSGVLQAWRMAGQVVTVQLLSRKAGTGPTAADRGTGDVLETEQVTLGGDGEEVPVKFQVTPDQLGRRTLCLKVLAPASDRQRDDDFLEADIEIVDHKNHVLLLAGGPTREYQFLRNLLYRDRSIVSDVLLQTGRVGISQEAHQILQDFPDSREAMYQYDCVVAFDPDWQALSAAQVDLLEGWVAEQGGGLIVVAGPVYTGKAVNGWVQDPAMAKVRALYPVEFQRSLSPVESNMYVAEEPWSIDFSREGLEADFLSLAESLPASRQAWKAFPGVFSYFPVRGHKQGATVLARFSDPRTAVNGQQPVYLAWQFYGSGRVFYLASGEMWRLREADETYFEQFYTQVIRHVSKGRLLRGSTRGMLLVGQERYWLGNTVAVQAYRLTNAQLEPLVARSVALEVFQPDQTVQAVTLRPDAARPGSYVGQFTVLQEGDYRLELPLSEGDDERLTQRIHVEIPNLEREHPQRNGPLLREIAAKTGGKYFEGLDEFLDRTHPNPLPGLLKDRTKTIILTAAPSALFEEAWLRWLMYALFGLLCLEWLLRRLAKLA